MYAFSIFLIVMSNVLYNIVTKLTPTKVNPFASLFVTYLVAAVVTLIAYQINKSDRTFLQSLKDLNWSSYVLGFVIVGLESGYIVAYRAGWNISIGSLVANISLAILLIPVGLFFFKEDFSVNKVIGVTLCVIGLIVINQ